MRRIVVTEFVSLDGVMEGPGGEEGYKHSGWTFKFQDQEGYSFKYDELMEHDAHLLGRVTYEGFAAAWPGRKDKAGFADRINAMKKYVVSTTLSQDDLTWENSELIGGDVSAVAELKEGEGGDILVAGSRTLVQSLHEAGLVDEYRLMVFPVVLGSGRRLFGETDDLTALKLVDSKPLDSGTVILTYRRTD